MTLLGDYDIQLIPEKDGIKEIDNIKMSYIIPNTVLKVEGIDGLVFSGPDKYKLSRYYSKLS